MIDAGADKLCFVISPEKSDIIQYYGSRRWGADLAYVVQPKAAGLCDAIFCAAPLVHESERVLIGLPDTIWFPRDGLARLPDDALSLLLFPVEHPEFFDAVLTDAAEVVREIEVKRKDAHSNWIWGAMKMTGTTFHQLHRLWRDLDRGDEYLGTLINAWLRDGGYAVGVRAGETYVDVGTLHGYREAILLLARERTGNDEPERKPEWLQHKAG
jgi:dTDP-glucose pyrophosphorylase